MPRHRHAHGLDRFQEHLRLMSASDLYNFIGQFLLAPEEVVCMLTTLKFVIRLQQGHAQGNLKPNCFNDTVTAHLYTFPYNILTNCIFACEDFINKQRKESAENLKRSQHFENDNMRPAAKKAKTTYPAVDEMAGFECLECDEEYEYNEVYCFSESS